jgi:hypothetical protein
VTQQATIQMLPGEKQDVREDARDLMEDGDVWFDTPNTLFGGKSAKEMLDEGREDVIRNALRSIRFGMFS